MKISNLPNNNKLDSIAKLLITSYKKSPLDFMEKYNVLKKNYVIRDVLEITKNSIDKYCIIQFKRSYYDKKLSKGIITFKISTNTFDSEIEFSMFFNEKNGEVFEFYYTDSFLNENNLFLN